MRVWGTNAQVGKQRSRTLVPLHLIDVSVLSAGRGFGSAGRGCSDLSPERLPREGWAGAEGVDISKAGGDSAPDMRCAVFVRSAHPHCLGS